MTVSSRFNTLNKNSGFRNFGKSLKVGGLEVTFIERKDGYFCKILCGYSPWKLQFALFNLEMISQISYV